MARPAAATEAANGMVVTAQREASAAGLAILKAGGNAIYAAVAAGYALAVVDPCCGNLGGGGDGEPALLDRLGERRNPFRPDRAGTLNGHFADVQKRCRLRLRN